MKMINILGNILLLLLVAPIGFVSCDSSDDALYSYSRENPTMPDFSLDEDEDEDVEYVPPVQDNTEWEATIYAEDYYGVVFNKHYLDLKNSANIANSETSAKTYFHTDNMNGVRVAIYGNTSAPAHPMPGVVTESYYAKAVLSIQNAQAVRGNRDFTVFASKKLNGTGTFPDWVKDSDGYIVPDQYAIMLFDFINYMDTQGIPIDILGIDNETEYNKGDITPDRHYLTVNILWKLLDEAGIKRPIIIGPDRFNCGTTASENWMIEFCSTKGNTTGADHDYTGQYINDYTTYDYANDCDFDTTYGNTLHIYGTHYYPGDVESKFDDLYDEIGSIGTPIHNAATEYSTDKGWAHYGLPDGYERREFWATEPHWNVEGNEQVDDGVLNYMGYTIGALWDMTDLGMDCLMWWGYSRGTDTRGNIMYAITNPIYGAQPVHMTDHDGEAFRKTAMSNSAVHQGLLHTRAFRNGNLLTVYMMNTSTWANESLYTNYTNYKFTLAPGMKIYNTTASRQQWRDDALIAGETIEIPIFDESTFYVDIPFRSFTAVTLEIVDDDDAN